MRKIITVILLLCLYQTSFSATFVVDSAGGGNYTTIQQCSNAANAGDTCSIQNGTYAGFTPNSGSTGLPIVFTAASGHTPVVNGEIDLSNGYSYVTISNLIIDDGSIDSHPFNGAKSNNLQIIGNTIQNTDTFTVAIQLKADDVLVSGNTYNNVGNDMNRIHGQRWVIRNNTVISEVDVAESVHMDFFQSFCSDPSPSTGISAQYGLVEGNLMARVSGEHVHFFLINGTADCNDPPENIIIRYNKVDTIGSMGVYIDNNLQAGGAQHNTIYNNVWSYMEEGEWLSWQKYCHIVDSTFNSSGINNIFYNSMHYENSLGFYRTNGSGWNQEGNLYFDSDNTITFSGDAFNETGAVKNEDPLFTDRVNQDFSLQQGSPAIDAARHLTIIDVSDAGSGTSLVVEKAEFFQPGWAGTEGDWIAVGDSSNTTQITSIDYSTNTLTIDPGISRSSSDPVYLYRKSDGERVFHGILPDIGALEYVTVAEIPSLNLDSVFSPNIVPSITLDTVFSPGIVPESTPDSAFN